MDPSGTLIFDTETHDSNLLYTLPPEEFVRLIGYKWRDDTRTGHGVTLTTDLDELREQILKARWIIGHNIHTFDLRAVFGIYSDIPMQLADEGRVYDTWTHAVLVNTAPARYTNRHGKPARAEKPDEAKRWYSLDEQAYQLGVPGKTHDLAELALEFAPKEGPAGEKLNKRERIAAGLGLIPLDDQRYQDYLIGDVRASEAVAQALLKLGPLDDYALREQRIESRKAAMQSNGWRVSREKAQARVDKLAVKRDEIMEMLVQRYDFPTEGKQPWRTDQGKHAVLKALAEHGVTEMSNPEWPRSEKTGALSLGGEVLLGLTKGTAAEELGGALAELMGQRSLAQLALDSMYPDGKVHPEITMLQKSGRWSTTKPGLTVWTAHGDNAVEKEYFLPDSDDEVLLEFDLSNADARAVAAYSGDARFAERFKEGADGHLINAWAAWGKDVVGTDKSDPKTAAYRQLAKPGGHGWGYRIGATKLALTWNKAVQEAKAFIDGMNKAFSRVVAWQEGATRFASRHGYVQNPWGRRMPVDKGREYTQPAALLGQSATREIICDFILKAPHAVVRKLKAQIHDAVVVSAPRDNWEAWRDGIIRLLESHMEPPGGQRIEFPASSGPPGENWLEAGHD